MIMMMMFAMIAMRLMTSTGLNGEKADYEKLKKPLVLIALVPDLDLLAQFDFLMLNFPTFSSQVQCFPVFSARVRRPTQ